ncbi:unnamed protein product [Camellia sinensis]
MAMEVEIISTEAIKPSSPTPNHLKTFKISLLDQLVAPVFSKQIYFYLPSSPECAEIESKSKLLKSSLSQILSLFYPFAGRITANFSVDCNDDGAIFVEARARCHLSQILNQPSERFLRKFLPLNNIQSNDGDSSSPLLLIQSTFFECGGAAIGLLFHHKMADAAAMATFITAWASAARGESVSPPELLSGPTLFPPKDFLSNANLPTSSSEKTSIKRFVFSSSSIGNLKSEVAGKTIHQHQAPPQPTRVEAVSALIWKCATKASRSNSQTKPTVLLQSVNLRTRFNPPLPGNSMGNMVGYYPVTTSDDEIDMGKAVEELKKGLIEFNEGYVKKLQEKEGGCSSTAILERMKIFQRGDAEMYAVTSWCRFPVHEADFGWGKPVWVCTVYMPFKNVMVLLDSFDGGGIEAWVCLKEEDMAVFERDPELLDYAAVNPPVLTMK